MSYTRIGGLKVEALGNEACCMIVARYAKAPAAVTRASKPPGPHADGVSLSRYSRFQEISYTPNGGLEVKPLAMKLVA